jgi:hypothetical protein
VNRLAISALLAAALLGASAASAKEPPQTAVCGRSASLPTERACLNLDWRNQIAQLLVGSIGEPFHMRSRPQPAPFYSVTVRNRDRHEWDWSFLYVPSRGLIRFTSPVGMVNPGTRSIYWRTVPTNVTRAFEKLSKRLRPLSAPRRWR